MSIEPHTKSWFQEYGAYLTNPGVAAVAILPAFGDLEAKGKLQVGEKVEQRSFQENIKRGRKIAPITGLVIGAQMFLQPMVASYLVKPGDKPTTTDSLFSSAAVGLISAPFLAGFNGKARGVPLLETIRKLTLSKTAVICIQETAFVSSQTLQEKLQPYSGNSKVMPYLIAYASGFVGSLLGHPANTALTRWDENLRIENIRQLGWGALRKANGIGKFSVCYKLGKDTLEVVFEVLNTKSG